MAKLRSRIPWWKYVGNILPSLMIIAQIVSVESSSGTNDTGSVINSEEGNLTDFFDQTDSEEVSIQELLSVEKNLQSVIEHLSKLPGGQVPSNSTLCISRICELKNQAQQLLKITNKLEQSKLKNSNGQVAGLEEEYRSKYLQFNRTLDNMKDYISDVEKRYNETVVNLEAFKLKLQEYETQIIDATLTHINAQKPRQAYDEFNHLKYSNSFFQLIIERAWTLDSTGIDNILEFIAAFPSCQTRAPLYKILFDFMDKYRMLSPNFNPYNTKVYLFFDEIQLCSNYLEDVKKQLSIYCDNITSKWADDIRNDLQEEIQMIQFFTSRTSKNERSIDIRLSDIVQQAYNNKIENIVKTVEFVYGLPKIKHVFNGYVTLFDAMNKNGHLHTEGIIKFALRLKQTIQDVNFCSTVKNHRYLEDYFYNLRGKFPSLITNLTWNGICTITNFQQTEYLYASDDYFTDAYRSYMRKILTRISGSELPQGNKWNFYNQPRYDTFYISHSYFSYSNYLTLDYPKVVVGYSVSQIVKDKEYEEYANSRWKLIPQTVDNQKLFVLKNELGMQDSPSKRLNIASSFDSQSHWVNYDDWDQKAGYWILDCQRGIAFSTC